MAEKYVSPWADAINEILGRAQNYGSYSSPYAEEIAGLLEQSRQYGSYESPYAEEINKLLNEAKNSKFSYDAEQDPNFKALRRRYRLEKDQTVQDVLGQASAATGGRASSYAVNAAGQAANVLTSDLADKQIQLYESAYNQWSDRYSKLLSLASALEQRESTEHAQWSEGFSQLLNSLGAFQTQDQIEYGKYTDGWAKILDELGIYQTQDQTDYGKWLDEQERADSDRDEAYERLRDLITNTGYSPTDAELAAAGMSREEANSWGNYYKESRASGGGSSSGSGYSYSSGGSDSESAGNESYETPDYSSWDAATWYNYFAAIRESEGAAAAQEELSYFTANGLIPKNMTSVAGTAARGNSGHSSSSSKTGSENRSNTDGSSTPSTTTSSSNASKTTGSSGSSGALSTKQINSILTTYKNQIGKQKNDAVFNAYLRNKIVYSNYTSAQKTQLLKAAGLL